MRSPFADLPHLLAGCEVLIDPAAVAPFGHDHLGSRGAPGAVVRPRTTEDVSRLLALAGDRGFAVVPRAAATNLCGAVMPTQESVVVDMTVMDRVLRIDGAGLRADVEPGALNGVLQQQVAPLGLCFSPDPASRAISTIGGNIACNAGGPGCIKYGVTFHHVHALEVVMAGGRVVELTDEDPVDLLGLIIGSEGTLGIVTRATVRLRPVAQASWTALASFERIEDATLAVSSIIAERVGASALELLDRRGVQMCDAFHPTGYPTEPEALLFAELEGAPEEVAADVPRLLSVLRRADPALRIAATPQERAALWAGRLSFGLAAVAGGKRSFHNDMSVPRQRIPEMVDRAREVAARHALDVPIVGHAGDGNIHPVILFDDAERHAVAAGAFEMTEAALDLGGTITGEHGVGVDKLPHMARRFTPAEIASFRAIKRAFDPDGLLNPEVLLPAQSPAEPDASMFERRVRRALAGAPLTDPAGPAAVAPEPADIVVDEENLTLDAGAAARCSEVMRDLRRRGLACAALEDAGSVGAAVGSPGRRAVRASLLAIEADLGHGRVRFGSAAVKDVAGLDAKRLLSGTGDAFGTIRRAVFRLSPRR